MHLISQISNLIIQIKPNHQLIDDRRFEKDVAIVQYFGPQRKPDIFKDDVMKGIVKIERVTFNIPQ
jgi:hypothetical protein